MKYEWEDEVPQITLDLAGTELPTNLVVVGVCVVNVDHMEGALIPSKQWNENEDYMSRKDTWLDILGDAHAQYDGVTDDLQWPDR